MARITSPDDSSFSSLLEAVRAGSSEARGVLLSRFLRFLLSRARAQRPNILWSTAGDSDYVQDTYVRVLQRLDQFSGATQGEFIAWLEQILHRCVLNGIAQFQGTQKRSVTHEFHFTPEQLERLPSKPRPSTSGDLDDAELEEEVKIRLRELSAEERRILALKYRGHTVRETAELLGKSPAAIHQARTRAMQKLRKLYGQARGAVSGPGAAGR